VKKKTGIRPSFQMRATPAVSDLTGQRAIRIFRA
jgi:hypothetical protein